MNEKIIVGCVVAQRNAPLCNSLLCIDFGALTAEATSRKILNTSLQTSLLQGERLLNL